MGELWPGFEERPVIAELNDVTVAEVLLRVGALTGWIGSAKQIEGSQETAKNLISESITIFRSLQNIRKVAEAESDLSVCYWREGTFNEARVWLRDALEVLPANADDEVRAAALLRLAIVERSAKRFHDALRIHIEAAPLFQKSSNDSLKGKFYNGFGFVLRNLGTTEKRGDYIDRALIEYAAASYHFEQAGHTLYQACVENNLGFLFCTTEYRTKIVL
ncbi:MAG: tetratricopeptide repeat protein [Pyrinomonadaceae bacterium]